MREAWLPLLRCPVTGAAYDLDATRSGAGEVVEGFLVARGGHEVRPVLAGLAVLPCDLSAHLGAYGNVYERVPLADSRVVRFVLGRVGHRRHDRVPFEEIVERYGDLLPPGAVSPPPAMAPADAALSRLLAELAPSDRPGLDVGCGVGRGAFLLRGRCPMVLGVDRSLARVRRSRNIAHTEAHFHLPRVRETDTGDIPLELHRLEREGVDFAVAEAEALPIADAALGVVVLRGGDGLGPFAHPDRALSEARRVLAPGGVLITEAGDRGGGPDGDRLAAAGPLMAWRPR